MLPIYYMVLYVPKITIVPTTSKKAFLLAECAKAFAS